MAIQDFTAGQVLTAAQMDALQANDYNQTVSNKTASYTLVAADKGTRIAMNVTGAAVSTDEPKIDKKNIKKFQLMAKRKPLNVSA
jgi:hypothetical protein